MHEVWRILLASLLATCALAFAQPNTPSELAIDKRIERGQAFVPDKRYPVSDEWIEAGCPAQFPDAKAGPGRLVRENCIDERAARMPAFDPKRAHHFGEQYSPKAYRDCENKYQGHSTQCHVLELRRIENPYHWPHEHNKDFKWPEAPQVNVYRSGMTRDEYHKALCDAEAGEFITKANVPATSLYIVRPYWTSISHVYGGDRYVEEAPYLIGQYSGIKPVSLVWNLFTRTPPMVFRFVEVMYPPARSSGVMGSEDHYMAVWRGMPLSPETDHRAPPLLTRVEYVSAPTQNTQTRNTPINRVESRYGVIWRSIERPNDRELKVAGTEVAVVDLSNNEVLGVLRNFSRLGRFWEGSGSCELKTCPNCGVRPFLHRVLSVPVVPPGELK